MKWNKILKEDPYLDRKIRSFEKFERDQDFGEAYIEFMKSEDSIYLVAKFDGKISDYIESEKPIYFSNIEDFINFVKKSIHDYYGSDIKKVNQNVIDQRDLKNLRQQIYRYAKEYPLKSKSLNYGDIDPDMKTRRMKREKNSGWDILIKFKRTIVGAIKNNTFRIIPVLTGANKFGKIINTKEKEVDWKKRDLERLQKIAK